MQKTGKVDKAKTHGISFKPSWLYAEARKYGRSLRHRKNASEVVCEFLQEGLISAGWIKTGPEPHLSPEMMKILTECEQHGFDWRRHLATGLIEHANRTPPTDPAKSNPAA